MVLLHTLVAQILHSYYLFKLTISSFGMSNVLCLCFYYDGEAYIIDILIDFVNDYILLNFTTSIFFFLQYLFSGYVTVCVCILMISNSLIAFAF